MAPRNPRPQDDVLFEGSDKWNRSVDHEFVKQLVKFCNGRASPLTKNDTNIIGASMEVVNQKCNLNFTQHEVVYWFKRLEKRWKAFGFAINVQGVRYDPHRNIIRCNATLWDYIYVYHQIAEAYMVCGETEWVGLQKIFGPPMATDPFNCPEIIQISDDSVDIVNPNTEPRMGPLIARNSDCSGEKSNNSLGSSFWGCLEPIQQLTGGPSSSRAHHHNQFNYGPFNPSGIVALDSEDSVDGEHDNDPLGSQASSSAPPLK